MEAFKICTLDFLITDQCNLRCDYCFENKQNNIIDLKKLKQYIIENQPRSLYPFGGEPMLYLDEIIEMMEFIKENPLLSEDKKQYYITNFRNMVTNGVLIKENIEKLKEHNFRLQVSLDGCRLAHNKHRKYPNGEGSYDKIMDGVMTAIKEGVYVHTHSVATRETIPYVYRTLKLIFHLTMLIDGLDKTIDEMGRNMLFFIFEDDYTDRDINIAIVQFYKFFKWIKSRNFLHEADKRTIYERFVGKKCSSCNSGVSFLGVDTNFNMYPCHRVVLSDIKEDIKLGNIFDGNNLINTKLYNSYSKLKYKHKLYSAVHNIDMNIYPNKKIKNDFYMWCPSTNLEVSGTPYYQPSKYNVLIKELQRGLEWIGKVLF